MVKHRLVQTHLGKVKYSHLLVCWRSMVLVIFNQGVHAAAGRVDFVVRRWWWMAMAASQCRRSTCGPTDRKRARDLPAEEIEATGIEHTPQTRRRLQAR